MGVGNQSTMATSPSLYDENPVEDIEDPDIEECVQVQNGDDVIGTPESKLRLIWAPVIVNLQGVRRIPRVTLAEEMDNFEKNNGLESRENYVRGFTNGNDVVVQINGSELPDYALRLRPPTPSDEYSMGYTALAVITQLAGSLLAFRQGGPGSSPAAEVRALLYAAAICNAAGFFSCFSGIWLRRHGKPAGSRIMEAIGTAFSVSGFLGMMGIFFMGMS